MLEGPLRRLFFDRERTLQRSGLGSGMRALEVGPGGGYLTERAVEVLGPKGTLVCLDLQIEMLRKVGKRLGTRAPLLVCAKMQPRPSPSRGALLVTSPVPEPIVPREHTCSFCEYRFTNLQPSWDQLLKTGRCPKCSQPFDL